MNLADMEAIALGLVAPGKGILAADESGPTIEKRFKSVGVVSTEEYRRAYRELLFTTPGVDAFISGVILYDETIRQQSLSPLSTASLRLGCPLRPGNGCAGFS